MSINCLYNEKNIFEWIKVKFIWRKNVIDPMTRLSI